MARTARFAAAVTPNDAYWARVRARAAALGSDGCTGVSEWQHDCCLLHDILCRTGVDMDSVAVTRTEADALFWKCLTDRSPLGVWSPRAWLRYAGVRLYSWWRSSHA